MGFYRDWRWDDDSAEVSLTVEEQQALAELEEQGPVVAR
ncbi:hypothetical protein C8E97_3562 [Saccharothrix australiensis]|uniref:Uncharacterized protein n=1 Tax=Saccharothrix australiensis TaxID=2072 RepID=A0A495W1B0_9PSEU|nr:hypothetical protein C8E97_3562 [Saccharothrix australiensis]